MRPEPRPRPRALAPVLLAFLVLFLGVGPATPAHAADAAASAAKPRFGPAVLKELNRIRARHDLPRVRIDGRMSRVAAAHSRDMRRRGYFSHGSWSARVARAAGSPSAVGEVLGWLTRSTPRREAKGIVRGWLRSPAHRSVLLDDAFRRVGIGRAAGPFAGQDAAVYTVDWASAR